MISIHALLAESDPPFYDFSKFAKKFLSTLSLRRATSSIDDLEPSTTHFYPRSPCGERRGYGQYYIHAPGISIHALLAESDERAESHANSQQEFLSTLSLRRATSGHETTLYKAGISIHALLAESDAQRFTTLNNILISIHALLAESDLHH